MLDYLVYFWLSCNKTEVRQYDCQYHKTQVRAIKWYNKGGTEIAKAELQDNIMAVLDRLTFVPSDEGICQLVLETIMVESASGKHVKQVKGPALGAMQIEPTTYKDLKQWLKSHQLVNRQVMSFIDKNVSEEYNLKYNIAFNMALTVAIYYRYNGDNLPVRCRNKYMRYLLYKSRFNTIQGATTAQKYFERSK